MKEFNSVRLKRLLGNLGSSVVSVILSIIAGSIVVWAVGSSPVTIYSALFKGAFGGTVSIVGTLNKMAPVLLAGLSIAIGNSAGMFNIGFSGQFLFGALAAAWIGVTVEAPSFVVIPLMMLAGIAAACIWSIIPVYAHLARNVNFVFIGIMMNFIALYLCSYTIEQFPGYNAQAQATPEILYGARLPSLFGVGINASVLISLLFVVLIYVIMFKTRIGYEMRAVGQNSSAALSAGIPIKSRMFCAGFLSAALAGIAGALEISGSTYVLMQEVEPLYLGYGIVVSLLGKQNPAMILVAAFLFSGIKNGSTLMQFKTGMSANFVQAIQGMLIIFVCAEPFIRYLFRLIKSKQTVSSKAD